jgi:predicted transcriptional regulator of viral defense system
MLTTTNKLQTMVGNVFSTEELAHFLGGSKTQRYNKFIKPAIDNNELIRIKRGLYVISPKYTAEKLNEYSIANQLVNNSYVSFETALSYHQWIPERVTIIASAIAKRKSVSYKTPFGLFEYKKIAIDPIEFFTGVSREEINGKYFWIATPLRALADLIFEREWQWVGIDFLTDGLRIDEDELETLKSTDFENIMGVYQTKNCYHARQVNVFLSQLRKELGK